ncbi:MAG: glycerate kinase [Aeromicrobium sp.]
MRVLVAPDKFAGTLTAAEAVDAIADGWRRQAPDDVVTRLPMSDGGPGFASVLGGAQGADRSTAYIESAEYCGHGQVPGSWDGSTAAVGRAVLDAVAGGATKVVVGLGGSATNDGGAGFLSALGGTADVPLDAGPAGLRGVSAVDLAGVHEALRGVELVAAADVDIPLLGLFGATKTFGPQKGLSEEDLPAVDGILDDFVVAVLGAAPAERRLAEAPGAGAAGGLGFAILLAGGTVQRGVNLVADAVGLADACASADLVITGEGTYDHTSRSGKVVFGVAERAAAAARPCIVLAGQVTVGSREARAMGVDAAYAVADVVGLEGSFADPAGSLATLAERAARTWSRQF